MNFKTLICDSEDSTAISLGRVAFWLTFLLANYFWFFVEVAAFPPTLFNILSLLLMYNISKKGVSALDGILKKKIENFKATSDIK